MKKNQLSYGIQLYGLMANGYEPQNKLELLKEIGYNLIEPCLLAEIESNSDIWGRQDLKRAADQMHQLGLEMKSCHLFFQDWTKIAKRVSSFPEEYQITQMVLNCPREITAETYTEFLNNCVGLAKELEQYGAKLMLHNNASEIFTKLQGVSAYEWMLVNGDGLIRAQVDVGWVAYAGEDECRFLEKNKSYIESVHLKDVLGTKDSMPPSDAAIVLGKGILNLRGCVDLAMKEEWPLIVDQDASDGSLMQDIQESVELLKSIVNK